MTIFYSLNTNLFMSSMSKISTPTPSQTIPPTPYPTRDSTQKTPTGVGTPSATTITVGNCADNAPTLTCPVGTTIRSGTIKYGRWNNNTCPHSTVNTNTSAIWQVYNIPNEAIGQNTYKYPSYIKDTYDDPYPGIYKKYEINFICM